MTSSATTRSAPRGSRHVGPPLLPLVLISVALFAAGLVVGATGGGPFPSPHDGLIAAAALLPSSRRSTVATTPKTDEGITP